ncbi:hypothetical protein CMMCAS06_13560 [Clavibacter michiganensis subsp. michiganensis]|nr:hypothetical protein CMMCAS06_13560 [Clavibacter michiganensis subsp. michiganensis]
MASETRFSEAAADGPGKIASPSTRPADSATAVVVSLPRLSITGRSWARHSSSKPRRTSST